MRQKGYSEMQIGDMRRAGQDSVALLSGQFACLVSLRFKERLSSEQHWDRYPQTQGEKP